jgi:hypothetical protein
MMVIHCSLWHFPTLIMFAVASDKFETFVLASETHQLGEAMSDKSLIIALRRQDSQQQLTLLTIPGFVVEFTYNVPQHTSIVQSIDADMYYSLSTDLI